MYRQINEILMEIQNDALVVGRPTTNSKVQYGYSTYQSAALSRTKACHQMSLHVTRNKWDPIVYGKPKWNEP